MKKRKEKKENTEIHRDTLDWNDWSLWVGAREISVKSDLVGSNRCLWIGAREISIEVIQKIDSERKIGIEMIGARELRSCGSV